MLLSTSRVLIVAKINKNLKLSRSNQFKVIKNYQITGAKNSFSELESDL
jgi:hypothetical protein